MVQLSSKRLWCCIIQILLGYSAHGNLSIFQDIAEDPKFVVNFTNVFIGETSLSFYMNPSTILPGIEPEALNGTSTRRFVLRREDGNKFLCNVISPQSSGELTESNSLNSDELVKVADNEVIAGVDIINSLKGDCLLMQAGWWTYKFCFNGEVSQFHLPTAEEAKNEKGLIIYTLGKFSKSLPVSPPEGRLQAVEEDSRSPSTVIRPTPNKNILVQQWGGGSACSLNSQPRSVEVHYMCIPGQKARIISIKEPRSCHYLIEISTPQLCLKSFFAEKTKPPIFPIHCAEVVPDDQVESRTKEFAAIKEAEESRPSSEQSNPQMVPKPNLSQLKYLGHLIAEDDPTYLSFLANHPESKYTSDSSVLPETPDQAEEEDDKSSPDKPSEELYGTITKILDLLKYELSPIKKEEPSDDPQEDEL